MTSFCVRQSLEIMSAINDLPAVDRRHETGHEQYYIPYMLRIQCIGYIQEFFGNFITAVSSTFAVYNCYGQQHRQTTLCLWLITVDMRRTKPLKIAYINYISV